MDSESSTRTGFPYRFCYNCKYLVFSKESPNLLFPDYDDVCCDAAICASEQGCTCYCPESGQSLTARYVLCSDEPRMLHTVYWHYY